VSNLNTRQQIGDMEQVHSAWGFMLELARRDDAAWWSESYWHDGKPGPGDCAASIASPETAALANVPYKARSLRGIRDIRNAS
jgi:hypothetical protein